jgi:hypothetical protein
MDPRKKLETLKGSLESGVIDQKEYDEWEAKLKPEIDKSGKKVGEESKPKEEDTKKSSEYLLIGTIIAIIILIMSPFVYFKYIKEPEPTTLAEMHVANLRGKLREDLGYIYKDIYSFVNLEGVWHTQLTSPKGTKLYDMTLRFSPREVEDIPINGNLDSDFFNSQGEFYVTFDPTGNDFSYVGLAVADFNTHLAKVFEKNPIAACDRNETAACISRPIVTCEDRDKLVLYVRELKAFNIYYDQNCIVVEGEGEDLVKGVDRILYNLYNIMEQ